MDRFLGAAFAPVVPQKYIHLVAVAAPAQYLAEINLAWDYRPLGALGGAKATCGHAERSSRRGFIRMSAGGLVRRAARPERSCGLTPTTVSIDGYALGAITSQSVVFLKTRSSLLQFSAWRPKQLEPRLPIPDLERGRALGVSGQNCAHNPPNYTAPSWRGVEGSVPQQLLRKIGDSSIAVRSPIAGRLMGRSQ